MKNKNLNTTTIVAKNNSYLSELIVTTILETIEYCLQKHRGRYVNANISKKNYLPISITEIDILNRSFPAFQFLQNGFVVLKQNDEDIYDWIDQFINSMRNISVERPDMSGVINNYSLSDWLPTLFSDLYYFDFENYSSGKEMKIWNKSLSHVLTNRELIDMQIKKTFCETDKFFANFKNILDKKDKNIKSGKIKN